MRSSGKLAGCVATFLLALLLAGLTGCGGGSSSTTSTVASITLSPAISSLNFGDTVQFTATAFDANRNPVTPTFTYASNNPNLVGISSGGLACGGHWDVNFITCTGGQVGIAQITASANGVTSPPVKVYVHQKVNSVSIVPGSVNCVSKGGHQNFTATAINNVLGDITSTVGLFNWQAVDPGVAVVNGAVNGLGLNQAVATAITPGKTGVFASISGVNSVPSLFEVCPVQSILLSVNNVPGQTSVTIGPSATARLTPTVTDSNGVVINPALTFTSSQAGVTTVGPAGLITGVNPGTATAIASCTPPLCNTNLSPTYPSNVVTVNVTGAPASFNVWVTSGGCAGHSGCTTSMVPIATPANTLGTAVSLPEIPNSLTFGSVGSKAYVGGEAGLMIVDGSVSPPTVNTQPAVTGKVLAVSQNGSKILVSDPTRVPSDSFVFDTTTAVRADLNVGGISAGDFSPDSLKAFVVNGSLTAPPSSPDLTIYSPFFAQLNLALASGSNPLDVSFFPTGGFAYIAGAEPGSKPIAVRATCDTSPSLDFVDTIQTTGTPSLIRPLPDGSKILAVVPPNMEVITPTLGSPGPCPQTVTDTVGSPVPLAAQNFTAIQMVIAPDGSKAYVLTKEIPGLLVFDVASNTASTILLAGGAFPLSAVIRPDNTSLYVGASDRKVHQIRVSTQSDVAQIGGLSLCSIGCNPEFLALQP